MHPMVYHHGVLFWTIFSHFSFFLCFGAVVSNRLRYVLAIHGGVGVRSREQFEQEPELEQAYREGLRASLQKGFEVLQDGGTALDAVESAVCTLEDHPLFNAGRGSSFTAAGTLEMDASIMDGREPAAGAVAAISGVKNPISLARLVMERTPHVLLVGEGALEFARSQGVEPTPPEYFFTEHKWEELQRVLENNVPYGGVETGEVNLSRPKSVVTDEENKTGTVGAVALDSRGNLAAATSTGGITKKLPGRVGDSPLIGAGTYANNATCAVSTTGLGEKHMLLLPGKEISDWMELKGFSLARATELTMLQRLRSIGGLGGAVALDRDGNIAMPYCTRGMYRGYVREDGTIRVFIFEQ